MNDNSPMLGIFWFFPGLNETSFLTLLSRFDEVPCVGGFRTTDIAHVDAWRDFQKQYPSLRRVGYEAIPRGRVNWRQSDERFLILVDRTIIDAGAIPALKAEFNLPSNSLVMTDSHYRTHKLTSVIAERN